MHRIWLRLVDEHWFSSAAPTVCRWVREPPGYSRGPRDVDGDVTPEDPLGRLAWFENPASEGGAWIRHDVSRRKRGMFDKFIPLDMDGDGDIDFVSTRGNSIPNDGVFWLEQVRSDRPLPAFEAARENDSAQMPLPSSN